MSFQRRITNPYPNARYSFDTNIYISNWRFRYPPDVFPSLYLQLQNLIKEGIIKSTYAVYVELEKQRDEIFKFFKKFDELFVEPLGEEQKIVTDIVNHKDFPDWSVGDSEKHFADPYIVALAKAYSLKVVTYESHDRENSILRACNILNVECYSFIDFLREESIKI